MDQQPTSSIKADGTTQANVEANDSKEEFAASSSDTLLEDLLSPAAEPFAETYVPPAKGTIFTYHNNWASLPKVIKYKVSGQEVIGRTKYLKLTSVEGLKTPVHAYYDMKNFNLKGYRATSGKALVTFKPAEQRYRFPLKPGNRWVTSWRSKDHAKDAVTSGGGVVQVERFETLKLAGGVYRTVKVRLPVQKNGLQGLRHHVWFSPELGVTVKEQITGRGMNWTQVLEKVEHSG